MWTSGRNRCKIVDAFLRSIIRFLYASAVHNILVFTRRTYDSWRILTWRCRANTTYTSFIRLLYTLAPFTSYTRFTTLTHGFTHWATSGLADCRITDSQLTREYVHTLRRTTTDRTHTTDWLNLEELTTDHSCLENTFTLMEEQQLWHWDRARIYIPQMVEGPRTNKAENFLKKNNPIHLSQIAPSCRLSLRTLQGLDRGDSSYSTIWQDEFKWRLWHLSDTHRRLVISVRPFLTPKGL